MSRKWFHFVSTKFCTNVFKVTIPTINLPETNKHFDLKFKEICELLIYNIFLVQYSLYAFTSSFIHHTM